AEGHGRVAERTDGSDAQGSADEALSAQGSPARLHEGFDGSADGPDEIDGMDDVHVHCHLHVAPALRRRRPPGSREPVDRGPVVESPVPELRLFVSVLGPPVLAARPPVRSDCRPPPQVLPFPTPSPGDGRPASLLGTEKTPCLKVLIDAPLAVRAKRIASREATTVEDAKREILARERSERIRYKSIYGIDVGDTRIFDLVIDSRDRTPDEIVAMIAARVRG